MQRQVDQSRRKKGHHIATIDGDQDYIEDSLPSSLMEDVGNNTKRGEGALN